MTCPQCLIALAGFGEDDVPALDTYIPTDMAQAISPPQIPSLALPAGAGPIGGLFKAAGQALMATAVGGVSGSLIFALAGSLLWKDHRVLGGLLGLLGGGAVGAGIGALVGKSMAKQTLVQASADGGYQTGGLLPLDMPPPARSPGEQLPPLSAGPLMIGPGGISSDGVRTIGITPRPAATVGMPGAATGVPAAITGVVYPSARTSAPPTATTTTARVPAPATGAAPIKCAPGYALNALGKCVLQQSAACPPGTVRTATGACAPIPSKTAASQASPSYAPTVQYAVQPDPRAVSPSLAYGGQQPSYPGTYGGAIQPKPGM